MLCPRCDTDAGDADECRECGLDLGIRQQRVREGAADRELVLGAPGRPTVHRWSPRALLGVGALVWWLSVVAVLVGAAYASAHIYLEYRLLEFARLDDPLVKADAYRIVEAATVRQRAMELAQERGLIVDPDGVDVRIVPQVAGVAPRKGTMMAELKEAIALVPEIADLVKELPLVERPVELKVTLLVEGHLPFVVRRTKAVYRVIFDGAAKSFVATHDRSGNSLGPGASGNWVAPAPTVSPLARGTLQTLDVHRQVEAALATALGVPHLLAYDPASPPRGALRLSTELGARLHAAIAFVEAAEQSEIVAWLGPDGPRLLADYTSLLRRLEQSVGKAGEAFGAASEPLTGYFEARREVEPALRAALEHAGIITPPL